MATTHTLLESDIGLPYRLPEHLEHMAKAKSKALCIYDIVYFKFSGDSHSYVHLPHPQDILHATLPYS